MLIEERWPGSSNVAFPSQGGNSWSIVNNPGPQTSGYAFSYKFPGTASGHDWCDNSLGVGAADWYLAIESGSIHLLP